MSHAGHHSVATENDLTMLSASLTEDGMSEAEAVTQVATIMYVRNFAPGRGTLYGPILDGMMAKCVDTLKSSGYEAIRQLADVQTPKQLWSAMRLAEVHDTIPLGIQYGLFDATGYSHLRGGPVATIDAMYIPMISMSDPACPRIVLKPWAPSCTLVAAAGADSMAALRSMQRNVAPYDASQTIPAISDPIHYGWRWLAGIVLSNQWRSAGFISILAMVDLINQVMPPPTPSELRHDRLPASVLACTLAAIQQQYLLQGTAYLDQRAGFAGNSNSARVGWNNPNRIITVINGRMKPCGASLEILKSILSTLNIQPRSRFKNDIAFAISRAMIRIIRDLSPRYTLIGQMMGYNQNYCVSTSISWWDLEDDGDRNAPAQENMTSHHMDATRLPFWDAFAAMEAEGDEDPQAPEKATDADTETAEPKEKADSEAGASDDSKSDDMTEKSTDAADMPNESGASADWSQTAASPGGSDTTEAGQDDVIDQAKASMLLGKEEQSRADAYLYKRAFLAYVNRAIETGTLSAEKASLLSTWTKAWLFLSPVAASQRLLRALGLRLPSTPI